MLGDVLLNFSNPQGGHHHSEVHHENGSFIPVSYFVKGPLEGMDIYQVWMAIASTTANCRSTLEASEFSKSKINQSEKVLLYQEKIFKTAAQFKSLFKGDFQIRCQRKSAR